MAKPIKDTEGATVPETATEEPANVQVQTLRKGVRIPCGTGVAIVSGIPNFLITRAVADELVAQGLVKILEQ